MSGSVLVPSSPTKRPPPISQSPAWSNASSSRTVILTEPVVRPLAFLASSADAYRTAAKKKRLPTQAKAYKRDNQANFNKTLPVKEKPHLPVVNRDDSLRIIETLTPGPKKVAPSPDDLHFKKLEPTSGIALRKRIFPHKDLEAHLDGRYYVPISKLYCIAQEGKCDDGEYAVPVEGDWVTMGVIVKKGRMGITKEKQFDTMGRLVEEDYVKAFGEGSHVEGKDTLEDGRKKEIITGKGETKKFGPREFQTLTLLDISNPPNQYGEHSGDNEILMTVFEADSTWVEHGGERKYAGGCCGAFEKLREQELGTVVCILNPKIRKMKRWKDNASSKSGFNGKSIPVKQSPRKEREESTHLFSLKPRTGNTVEIIGVARDFAICQKEGGCENFVDCRSGRRMCCEHSVHRFESKGQYGSNWTKPLGPSSDYDLSNGMAMGSKARQYTTKSLQDDPNAPGGLLYDISMHYGRARENQVAKEEKVDELLELRENLKKRVKSDHSDANSARAATSDQVSEIRLRRLAHQKNASKREAMANAKAGKGLLGNVIFDSAGSKIIEAARQAMELKRKERSDAMGPQAIKRKLDAQTTSRVRNDSCPDACTQSSSSSKLLARRSISSVMLPKPKLHNRKTKLSPTVRPPPGQSFYANESSDEELDEIMRGEEMEKQIQSMQNLKPTPAFVELSDSDSDIEIVP